MVNNKKRILTLVFIFTFWLVSFSIYKAYAEDTGLPGVFPNKSTLNITSTQTDLSNKYPLTHYSFDTEKFGILDSWASPLKALTNVFFLVIAFLNYIVDYLLMACFKFNIFDIISSGFDGIVWAIRDAVFLPMIQVITPIIGIVLLFNIGVGKFQNVWRIIFNTIVVLIIAFGFFSRPSYVINMVNQMSQGVSGNMLAGAARISTGSQMSSDDAVVTLGNSFWQNTVVKPWEIIEFGNANVSDQEVDNYLKYSSADSARKSLAKAAAKDNDLFTCDGQAMRLVMVFFMGLLSLIMGVFVLALAVVTMMLQFGAVISAILGVVAFTLALLPNMGLTVAIHNLYDTFGFLLSKIAMTLLLVVFFAINTTLQNLTGQYGWFLVMVFQIILIVSVIVFRKKIMGFAHAATGGQQRAIENVHKKGDSLKNVAKTAVGLYGAKKVVDDIGYMREARKDKKLGEKYEPVAKEFLHQRYTNEKRAAETKSIKAAEAKAAKEGKPVEYNVPVEYSDFVKTVDSRVDKGFNPFDSRDIDGTVNMMKRLHKQGNDPVNLLTTQIDGRKDKSIRFKQVDLEKSVEANKKDINERIETNKDKIHRNIKLNKESKLFSKKAAIINSMTGHDELGETGRMKDINLSSNTGGAINEINQDRYNRDYTEMRKQESVLENEKAQEQQEKQVVNSNRPIGKELIKGTATSKSTSVNKTTREASENVTETHRAEVKNETKEHSIVNEVTEKVANRKVENVEANHEVINKEETRNATAKNVENVTENNKRTNETVTNEVKNTIEHTEKSTNREINNTEEVHNTNKKTENVMNETVNIENVKEKNTRNVTNAIETVSNIKNMTDNVTSTERINVSNENNNTKKIRDIESKLGKLDKMYKKNEESKK